MRFDPNSGMSRLQTVAISRASADLGVSQPTATKHVAALEAKLEVRTPVSLKDPAEQAAFADALTGLSFGSNGEFKYPRITSVPKTFEELLAACDKLTAAGYRVVEVPMERECLKLVNDARRGKNMWCVGMLCSIYGRDLEIVFDEEAVSPRAPAVPPGLRWPRGLSRAWPPRASTTRTCTPTFPPCTATSGCAPRCWA